LLRSELARCEPFEYEPVRFSKPRKISNSRHFSFTLDEAEIKRKKKKAKRETRKLRMEKLLIKMKRKCARDQIRIILKLADIREKEVRERFDIFKREMKAKDARMKLNLIEEQWARKFQYIKKIPPNEEEKKHNLFLKYVRWKQKNQIRTRDKEIQVTKGKYTFKINVDNCEVNNWKERWRRAKDRWKTNIDIFQDVTAEDILAYLIIKDKLN
jgi:hypothetical protein